MRLFAALYLPPEILAATLDAIDAIRGPDDARPTVRWTAPELLHVTVAFFGEVPGGAVDDLASALADVVRDVDPLNLHLRGAGVFQDRVLWLGVGGDTGALRDLSADVARAGETVGLGLDRRPRQRAHLTIARARATAAARPGRGGRRSLASPAATALARYAAALTIYVGPAWTASELCLVQSDLTAERPVHTVVGRFALR